MVAEPDMKSTLQKDQGQLIGRCVNLNIFDILTFLVTQLTRSLGPFVLARLVVVV
jgi:hypothetical protein